MTTKRYASVHQYEPLVTPQNWKNEDERRLVNRLTEIFDDIYKRYGRLGLDDISKAFEDALGLIRRNTQRAQDTADSALIRAGNAKVLGEGALTKAYDAYGLACIPVGGVYVSVSGVLPHQYGAWESIGTETLFGITVYAWKRTA